VVTGNRAQQFDAIQIQDPDVDVSGIGGNTFTAAKPARDNRGLLNASRTLAEWTGITATPLRPTPSCLGRR